MESVGDEVIVPTTDAPSRRQMHIAMGMTAVILFAVVLANGLVLSGTTHDFAGIYAAARAVSHGEGSRLYDLSTQGQAQETLFHWGGVLAFLQPPFETWLFAPLALLPYTAAYVVWGAANIALWVAFVYLLRPYAPAPRHSLQYVLLCFLFFPAWVALMQGQTSILLLFLLSWAFVNLKRGREGWAGVCMGLGLIKFPVVVPLGLILLLKGKWRLMAGFAGTTVALGAVSLFTIGSTGMITYFHLLMDAARHSSFRPSGIKVAEMPNLRGFFHVVLSSVVSAPAINGCVLAASVLLIGYVVWRWRREGAEEGPAFDVMFAAALLIAQVTAFHLLIHDLSPALLAVLLIIGAGRYPQGSRWPAVGKASIAVLYAVPVCLLLFRAEPMFILAPVVVLLAWAGMAGIPRGGQLENQIGFTNL